MKDETKVSIITYAGIVFILLAAAGVAAFLSLQAPPPADLSECSPEPHSLINPTTPGLVDHALRILEEAGVISSVEDGREALLGIDWVIDPDEDYQIEYWITFASGDRRIAAEMNIICTSLEGQLNLEYEGSRVVD